MDKQKREFDQMLAESQAREQNAILQGVQKEQDAVILTFKSDVLFDTNSSTIKQTAYSSGEIDRVAQILNRYPETTIKVVGYTDSTGLRVIQSAVIRAAGQCGEKRFGY